MAVDTLQSDQHKYQNQMVINEGTLLYYDELPLKKKSRKPYPGLVNGVPCVVFRKKAIGSALNYILGKFPEIKEYFEGVQEYAPSILDCMVEHDRAFYFQAAGDGESHELLGIMELPLWETAQEDLYELSNLIRYCRDYEEDPDNVFMDDYGLC